MPDLASASTAWMDERWDADAGMLVHPEFPSIHGVRETACYALGSLIRAEGRDVDRARVAIANVIATQIHAPGQRFHGTYRRAPEEPVPGPDAVEWIGYDPNWRQFIGCILALVRDDFAGAVGDTLARDIDASIEVAVGSEPRDRVRPSYSNIAMMLAWLDAWAGVRYGDGDALARGETMARAVAGRVAEAGGLDEFNSPTYYGIDLFALALWRGRPPTEPFATLGAELEAALWRDIADLYHPLLRNLCGPWSRSYGMDMTSYVALLGMSMWDALGLDAAPFPSLDAAFGHAHDMCFGPTIAHVPTRVPEDVAVRLVSFEGPREVERTIAGRRLNACFEPDAMCGALRDGIPGFSDQIHPATAHWRGPDGRLDHLRVRSPGVVQGVAFPGRLELEIDGGTATAELSRSDAAVRFSRSGEVIDGDPARLAFGEGDLVIEVGPA